VHLISADPVIPRACALSGVHVVLRLYVSFAVTMQVRRWNVLLTTANSSLSPQKFAGLQIHQLACFLKVANSIKDFSELYKAYVQRENKSVILFEWLAAASPHPRKINRGFKQPAESK
jgi:hypothetical protein